MADPKTRLLFSINTRMLTTSPQEKDESGSGFWASRFGQRAKLVLLAGLIGSFILQTYLVYSDPPRSPPLSEQAQVGERLWLERNCQACHQLYGFGGFLGPDLTNASSRVYGERLKQVLTDGAGLMPAFQFSPDQIAEISAYLKAMDQTGQGQASIGGAQQHVEDSRVRFLRIVQAEFDNDKDDDASAMEGFGLLQVKGCLQCHAPFSIAANGAPDLSTLSRRFAADEIMTALEKGRPLLMPPPELDLHERNAMFLFLSWLTNHREELLARERAQTRTKLFHWTDLPWWEYPR